MKLRTLADVCVCVQPPCFRPPRGLTIRWRRSADSIQRSVFRTRAHGTRTFMGLR